jgi:hypothetical protein
VNAFNNELRLYQQLPPYPTFVRWRDVTKPMHLTAGEISTLYVIHTEGVRDAPAFSGRLRAFNLLFT